MKGTGKEYVIENDGERCELCYLEEVVGGIVDAEDAKSVIALQPGQSINVGGGALAVATVHRIARETS